MLFSNILARVGFSELHPVLYLPLPHFYYVSICLSCFPQLTEERSWPRGTPGTILKNLFGLASVSQPQVCLYDFTCYCLITALSSCLLFHHIFLRCNQRLRQRSCESWNLLLSKSKFTLLFKSSSAHVETEWKKNLRLTGMTWFLGDFYWFLALHF